ncbi:MAG TPA: response regulator [Thermoanaerobaculia bacterium]|nr:response regulator [Thermoanaerobaculia bacterium]
MKPIRAIIVDDEPLARDLLREYLEGEPDVDVVAECANGFEAVKAVAEHDPDVLLLDIQMPKLDGFEVLELLDREPLVVFITAHDEYAIRAFEARALDYLLKPVAHERFRALMDRVRGELARVGEGGTPARPAALASQLRQRPLERILVRLEEGGIEVVPVPKLDYVEAQDDWIAIATGGRKLRKQQTLRELEEQLDPRRFVRIHRSYLLNVERIQRVDLYGKDSHIAILRDGTKLPVSRSGYARLRELL